MVHTDMAKQQMNKWGCERTLRAPWTAGMMHSTAPALAVPGPVTGARQRLDQASRRVRVATSQLPDGPGCRSVNWQFCDNGLVYSRCNTVFSW